MLPMLLHLLLGYTVWYLMIRLALVGAWIYSKPGTFGLPQWAIIMISLVPGCMEVLSCALVVLALAMGFNPVRGTNERCQCREPRKL